MDSEAKKILAAAWADTGDRTDPEDPLVLPVLDRAEGYPVSFSTDPGDVPKRGRVNQRWRELDGAARDSMFYGGVLPYDAEVDYLQYAHSTVALDEYVATVANGPGTGNVDGSDDVGADRVDAGRGREQPPRHSGGTRRRRFK